MTEQQKMPWVTNPRHFPINVVGPEGFEPSTKGL